MGSANDSQSPSVRKGSALALAAFVVVTSAAACFGALFGPGEWYQALVKPSWTPPGWLFGPVWTLLYAMIATAGWLIWRRLGPVSARPLLAAWLVQLVLNALWSWLFFGLHRPGLALADLVALWAVIGGCVVWFRRAGLAPSRLMAPYLAWVTFAGALNFAIWRLNAA